MAHLKFELSLKYLNYFINFIEKWLKIRNYSIFFFLFFVETILIPKSKNNGNDRDYVYIDTLSGNDIGDFLSFEKKCLSKYQQHILPKLIKLSDSEGKLICY